MEPKQEEALFNLLSVPGGKITENGTLPANWEGWKAEDGKWQKLR